MCRVQVDDEVEDTTTEYQTRLGRDFLWMRCHILIGTSVDIMDAMPGQDGRLVTDPLEVGWGTGFAGIVASRLGHGVVHLAVGSLWAASAGVVVSAVCVGGARALAFGTAAIVAHCFWVTLAVWR